MILRRSLPDPRIPSALAVGVCQAGNDGECNFIERELNCDKSLRILDVGCGTGRHSIELAKRGYMIIWLLKSLGFKKVDIFGAKLGAYSREDQLTTEDFEMLVVAEK